jgi:5'-nucleotidase / UDP-sugar diphosphatase
MKLPAFVFKLSCALFLTGFLFSGCEADQKTIIIYHTNDSHSQINNFPKIKHLIDKERENTQHVFLVSTGDIFSGNPLIDHYDPPGYPKIDLMNKVGYSVTTIGNHEFDYGINVLKDRIEQASFPFILANADMSKTDLPQPPPYITLKAGKLILAFIGIVQLNKMGIPSTHPDRVKGIIFTEPIDKVADFKDLKEEVNAMIVLSHNGFLRDTIMAGIYPWLDAIIGGHSHTLTSQPQKHNGVLITQAGDNLNYIGKLTLTFKGEELIETFGEIIDLQNINEFDGEILAMVERYNDNPSLKKVICTLEQPISGKRRIACMTSDAYREFANVDFAIQNIGGVRVNSLKGEISIMDIYNMDPFQNELIRQDLSYSEIISLINNSFSSGYPEIQISGGRVEVKLGSDKKPKKIIIYDQKGMELSKTGKYSVAMPSYISSAFQYMQESPGVSTGVTTAKVVIDYLSRMNNITIAEEDRFMIK